MDRALQQRISFIVCIKQILCEAKIVLTIFSDKSFHRQSNFVRRIFLDKM